MAKMTGGAGGLAAKKPDVAIVNLGLPRMNGIPSVQRLTAATTNVALAFHQWSQIDSGIFST
jgi:DNA-binding response OmpR family regulator